MYNFGVVMTDEEKKLLSTFEARLRHLIYLHDELKRENAELKQLLEAKEEEYGKVQAEYRELELLKKFPGYPALYIGNGGSTFSPDTAIHIRGNAVLYKNPYFKQSKMKS